MHKPILKHISTALVLSFLLQDISWAAPEILHPDGPQKITLSSEFSKITDRSEGKLPKHIIHIQDAHTNLSAQKNLSRVVNELADRYKVQTVFVEGGTTDDSLTSMRALADRPVREHVAKKYMIQGELSGEEYLSLSSDLDLKILGVEDIALYKKNLEYYRSIAHSRTKLFNALHEIEKRADTLKRQLYPEALLDLDRIAAQFEDKEADLTAYYEALSVEAKKASVNMLGYPQFLMLGELKDKEAQIDFQKANAEQASVLQALQRSDPDQAQEFKKIAGKTQKMRYGSLELGSFYEGLLKAAQKQSVSTPELKRYTDYLSFYGKLDLEALIAEMKALEQETFARALPSSEAISLYERAAYLKALRALFSLQATRQDVDAYLEKKKDERFRIVTILAFLNRALYDLGREAEVLTYDSILDDNLKTVEAFYETTRERDGVFVQKALDQMDRQKVASAALITGGYHTQNLKKLLAERGVSYTVVTPHVFEETNMKRYEKLLLGQFGGGVSQGSPAMLNLQRTKSFVRLLPIAERPAVFARLKAEFADRSMVHGPQSTASGARLAGSVDVAALIGSILGALVGISYMNGAMIPGMIKGSLLIAGLFAGSALLAVGSLWTSYGGYWVISRYGADVPVSGAAALLAMGIVTAGAGLAVAVTSAYQIRKMFPRGARLANQGALDRLEEQLPWAVELAIDNAEREQKNEIKVNFIGTTEISRSIARDDLVETVPELILQTIKGNSIPSFVDAVDFKVTVDGATIRITTISEPRTPDSELTGARLAMDEVPDHVEPLFAVSIRASQEAGTIKEDPMSGGASTIAPLLDLTLEQKRMLNIALNAHNIDPDKDANAIYLYLAFNGNYIGIAKMSDKRLTAAQERFIDRQVKNTNKALKRQGIDGQAMFDPKNVKNVELFLAYPFEQIQLIIMSGFAVHYPYMVHAESHPAPWFQGVGVEPIMGDAYKLTIYVSKDMRASSSYPRQEALSNLMHARFTQDTASFVVRHVVRELETNALYKDLTQLQKSHILMRISSRSIPRNLTDMIWTIYRAIAAVLALFGYENKQKDTYHFLPNFFTSSEVSEEVEKDLPGAQAIKEIVKKEAELLAPTGARLAQALKMTHVGPVRRYLDKMTHRLSKPGTAQSDEVLPIAIRKQIELLAADKGLWGHGTGHHYNAGFMLEKRPEVTRHSLIQIILDRKINAPGGYLRWISRSMVGKGAIVFISSLYIFDIRSILFGTFYLALTVVLWPFGETVFFGPFTNKDTMYSTNNYGPHWVILDHSQLKSRRHSWGAYYKGFFTFYPDYKLYFYGIPEELHKAYLVPDQDVDLIIQAIHEASQTGVIDAAYGSRAIRKLVSYSQFIDKGGDIDVLFRERNTRSSQGARLADDKAIPEFGVRRAEFGEQKDSVIERFVRIVEARSDSPWHVRPARPAKLKKTAVKPVGKPLTRVPPAPSTTNYQPNLRQIAEWTLPGNSLERRLVLALLDFVQSRPPEDEFSAARTFYKIGDLKLEDKIAKANHLLASLGFDKPISGARLAEHAVRNYFKSRTSWDENIIVVDTEDFAKAAAKALVSHIAREQARIQALPVHEQRRLKGVFATGGTMKPIYRALAYMSDAVSWGDIEAFHLDEYQRLNASTERYSFKADLNRDLFNLLPRINRVPLKQIHFILDYLRSYGAGVGMRRYAAQLSPDDPADFMLLGMGTDGHIAFIMPGTPLNRQSLESTLTSETIEANRRSFPAIQRNQKAYTLGFKEILAAKHIFLFVNGEHKAEILAQVFKGGDFDPRYPASALQALPKNRITLVLDTPAARVLVATSDPLKDIPSGQELVRDLSDQELRVILLRDKIRPYNHFLTTYQKRVDGLYEPVVVSAFNLMNGHVTLPSEEALIRNRSFMRRTITLLYAQGVITKWTSMHYESGQVDTSAERMYEDLGSMPGFSLRRVNGHYVLERGARLADGERDVRIELALAGAVGFLGALFLGYSVLRADLKYQKKQRVYGVLFPYNTGVSVSKNQQVRIRLAEPADVDQILWVQNNSVAHSSTYLNADIIERLASNHQIVLAETFKDGEWTIHGAVHINISREGQIKKYRRLLRKDSHIPVGPLAGDVLYDFWIVVDKDLNKWDDLSISHALIDATAKIADAMGILVMAYSRPGEAMDRLDPGTRDQILSKYWRAVTEQSGLWKGGEGLRAKLAMRHFISVKNKKNRDGVGSVLPFITWLGSKYGVILDDTSAFGRDLLAIVQPSVKGPDPVRKPDFVKLIGLLMRQYLNENPSMMIDDLALGVLHSPKGAHLHRIHIDSRPDDFMALGMNFIMSYERVPDLEAAIRKLALKRKYELGGVNATGARLASVQEALKAAKSENKTYVGTVMRHDDGIGTAPTVVALKEAGLLDVLAKGTHENPATMAQIMEAARQRTGHANAGYFFGAMQILERQGFLKSKGEIASENMQYWLTAEGRVMIQLADAYTKAVQFIPTAKSMEEFLFSKPRDPPVNAAATEQFTELILSLRENLSIPERASEPAYEKVRKQIITHVEGLILGPVLVNLRWQLDKGRFDPTQTILLDALDGNTHHLKLAFELLEQKQMVEARDGGYAFTSYGLGALAYAWSYGVPVSYLPTFETATLNTLFFGSENDVNELFARRGTNNEELMVNRAMNVAASGAAHETYFEDMKPVLESIFNSDDLDRQPRGIADMGSGNGAFLKFVYEYVRDNTLRGKNLSRYPLDVIGADFNQAAREATQATLAKAGIAHHIIDSNINDPDGYAEKLTDTLSYDPGDLLHLRSFLDHNRPFIGVKDVAASQKRRTDSRATVAWRGRAIPSGEIYQNLVEHFVSWKKLIAKHGLMMIELLTIDPTVTAQNHGSSLDTGYFATHVYSDQILVELPYFLEAVREAGLEIKDYKRYAKSDELTTVIRARFVDGARLADTEERIQTIGRDILAKRVPVEGEDAQKDRALQWMLKVPYIGRLVGLGAYFGPLTRWLVSRFVAGETIEEAAPVLMNLIEDEVDFTLDEISEAAKTQAEADSNREAILKNIRWLGAQNLNGQSISIKLTALVPSLSVTPHPLTQPVNKEFAKSKVREILREAVKHDILVYIDLEEHEFRSITYAIYEELIYEEEFRNESHLLGVILQAYYRDAEALADRFIKLAKARNTLGWGPVVLRIVKGAYWEKEVGISEKQFIAPTVWFDHDEKISKALTDASYERVVDKLMPHHRLMDVAYATHNVRSMAKVIAEAEKVGATAFDFEFQMLYGMGDPFVEALETLGYRVRLYVPIGSVAKALPYFGRRMNERSARESALVQAVKARTEKDIRTLLAPPSGARLSQIDDQISALAVSVQAANGALEESMLERQEIKRRLELLERAKMDEMRSGDTDRNRLDTLDREMSELRIRDGVLHRSIEQQAKTAESLRRQHMDLIKQREIQEENTETGDEGAVIGRLTALVTRAKKSDAQEKVWDALRKHLVVHTKLGPAPAHKLLTYVQDNAEDISRLSDLAKVPGIVITDERLAEIGNAIQLPGFETIVEMLDEVNDAAEEAQVFVFAGMAKKTLSQAQSLVDGTHSEASFLKPEEKIFLETQLSGALPAEGGDEYRLTYDARDAIEQVMSAVHRRASRTLSRARATTPLPAAEPEPIKSGNGFDAAGEAIKATLIRARETAALGQAKEAWLLYLDADASLSRLLEAILEYLSIQKITDAEEAELTEFHSQLELQLTEAGLDLEAEALLPLIESVVDASSETDIVKLEMVFFEQYPQPGRWRSAAARALVEALGRKLSRVQGQQAAPAAETNWQEHIDMVADSLIERKEPDFEFIASLLQEITDEKARAKAVAAIRAWAKTLHNDRQSLDTLREADKILMNQVLTYEIQKRERLGFAVEKPVSPSSDTGPTPVSAPLAAPAIKAVSTLPRIEPMAEHIANIQAAITPFFGESAMAAMITERPALIDDLFQVLTPKRKEDLSSNEIRRRIHQLLPIQKVPNTERMKLFNALRSAAMSKDEKFEMDVRELFAKRLSRSSAVAKEIRQMLDTAPIDFRMGFPDELRAASQNAKEVFGLNLNIDADDEDFVYGISRWTLHTDLQVTDEASYLPILTQFVVTKMMLRVMEANQSDKKFKESDFQALQSANYFVWMAELWIIRHWDSFGLTPNELTSLQLRNATRWIAADASKRLDYSSVKQILTDKGDLSIEWKHYATAFLEVPAFSEKASDIMSEFSSMVKAAQGRPIAEFLLEADDLLQHWYQHFFDMMDAVISLPPSSIFYTAANSYAARSSAQSDAMARVNNYAKLITAYRKGMTKEVSTAADMELLIRMEHFMPSNFKKGGGQVKASEIEAEIQAQYGDAYSQEAIERAWNFRKLLNSAAAATLVETAPFVFIDVGWAKANNKELFRSTVKHTIGLKKAVGSTRIDHISIIQTNVDPELDISPVNVLDHVIWAQYVPGESRERDVLLVRKERDTMKLFTMTNAQYEVVSISRAGASSVRIQGRLESPSSKADIDPKTITVYTSENLENLLGSSQGARLSEAASPKAQEDILRRIAANPFLLLGSFSVRDLVRNQELRIQALNRPGLIRNRSERYDHFKHALEYAVEHGYVEMIHVPSRVRKLYKFTEDGIQKFSPTAGARLADQNAPLRMGSYRGETMRLASKEEAIKVLRPLLKQQQRWIPIAQSPDDVRRGESDLGVWIFLEKATLLTWAQDDPAQEGQWLDQQLMTTHTLVAVPNGSLFLMDHTHEMNRAYLDSLPKGSATSFNQHVAPKPVRQEKIMDIASFIKTMGSLLYSDTGDSLTFKIESRRGGMVYVHVKQDANAFNHIRSMVLDLQAPFVKLQFDSNTSTYTVTAHKPAGARLAKVSDILDLKGAAERDASSFQFGDVIGILIGDKTHDPELVTKLYRHLDFYEVDHLLSEEGRIYKAVVVGVDAKNQRVHFLYMPTDVSEIGPFWHHTRSISNPYMGLLKGADPIMLPLSDRKLFTGAAPKRTAAEKKDDPRRKSISQISRIRERSDGILRKLISLKTLSGVYVVRTVARNYKDIKIEDVNTGAEITDEQKRFLIILAVFREAAKLKDAERFENVREGEKPAFKFTDKGKKKYGARLAAAGQNRQLIRDFWAFYDWVTAQTLADENFSFTASDLYKALPMNRNQAYTLIRPLSQHFLSKRVLKEDSPKTFIYRLNPRIQQWISDPSSQTKFEAAVRAIVENKPTIDWNVSFATLIEGDFGLMIDDGGNYILGNQKISPADSGLGAELNRKYFNFRIKLLRALRTILTPGSDPGDMVTAKMILGAALKNERLSFDRVRAELANDFSAEYVPSFKLLGAVNAADAARYMEDLTREAGARLAADQKEEGRGKRDESGMRSVEFWKIFDRAVERSKADAGHKFTLGELHEELGGSIPRMRDLLLSVSRSIFLTSGKSPKVYRLNSKLRLIALDASRLETFRVNLRLIIENEPAYQWNNAISRLIERYYEDMMRPAVDHGPWSSSATGARLAGEVYFKIQSIEEASIALPGKKRFVVGLMEPTQYFVDFPKQILIDAPENETVESVRGAIESILSGYGGNLPNYPVIIDAIWRRFDSLPKDIRMLTSGMGTRSNGVWGTPLADIDKNEFDSIGSRLASAISLKTVAGKFIPMLVGAAVILFSFEAPNAWAASIADLSGPDVVRGTFVASNTSLTASIGKQATTAIDRTTSVVSDVLTREKTDLNAVTAAIPGDLLQGTHRKNIEIPVGSMSRERAEAFVMLLSNVHRSPYGERAYFYLGIDPAQAQMWKDLLEAKSDFIFTGSSPRSEGVTVRLISTEQETTLSSDGTIQLPLGQGEWIGQAIIVLAAVAGDLLAPNGRFDAQNLKTADIPDAFEAGFNSLSAKRASRDTIRDITTGSAKWQTFVEYQLKPVLQQILNEARTLATLRRYLQSAA